jgi:hypothetical protein
MTVEAAIGALRHDAGLWDEVAHVTDRAARAARGLGLTEGDLSWASVNTPLLGTYLGIQQNTARLLDEATDVYLRLKTTLLEVADAYEASDQDAAQRLKGVWDVRD